MGIYRTYFDKNNTIVRNSEVNTGRNQISELYFGAKRSRLLFYCSFDEIKNLISDKIINIDNETKHILKIKNTSSFDIKDFLSNSNNLLFNDNYRPTSFDLELHAVTNFWDEGTGYDFTPSATSLPGNKDYALEPSNWTKATNTSNFTIPGAVPSNSIAIATQHFDLGNEDVEMDITTFVNNYINNVTTGTTTGTTTGVTTGITTGITTGVTTGITTGVTTGITTGVTTGITTGTTYFGFCLKFSDAIEALDYSIEQKTFSLGLFTRHTQTFFEPFIETQYNDHVEDDRVTFYLGKDNKLFFYSIINGKPENLDVLPTCSINGVPYEVKQKTKGVYYIIVNGNESIFTSYTEYNDIWGNIRYKGSIRPNVKLRFVPIDSEKYYNFDINVLDDTRYGLSLSGIKREEKISQGEKRKVNILLRKPYTVSEYYVSNSVYYRIYVKQGPAIITIMDWQLASKSFNNNFFTLDTTWLVPQEYFVDIKVETGGETLIFDNELSFDIVNKVK